MYFHKLLLRLIWALLAFYFIGMHIGFVVFLLNIIKLVIPLTFFITLYYLLIGVIRDVDFCYLDYFNLRVLGTRLLLSVDMLLFIFLVYLTLMININESSWWIILSLAFLRVILWFAFRKDNKLTPNHNI